MENKHKNTLYLKWMPSIVLVVGWLMLLTCTKYLIALWIHSCRLWSCNTQVFELHCLYESMLTIKIPPTWTLFTIKIWTFLKEFIFSFFFCIFMEELQLNNSIPQTQTSKLHTLELISTPKKNPEDIVSHLLRKINFALDINLFQKLSFRILFYHLSHANIFYSNI